MMRTITITDFRRDMATFMGEVVYNKRRMFLGKHRDKIALICLEDLKKLEKYESEHAEGIWIRDAS